MKKGWCRTYSWSKASMVTSTATSSKAGSKLSKTQCIRKRKRCTLSYENTVVLLQYTGCVSTARKTQKEWGFFEINSTTYV
jgi:hypothetical protein